MSFMRRHPAKKQEASTSSQCTETTIKGNQCTFPAVEKGLCRLHLYLYRQKEAA